MPEHPTSSRPSASLRDPLRKEPPSDHKFTVGSYYRPGWPSIRGYDEPIPFLPLTGFCLEKAGFEIGAQVWVEAEPGRLVVLLKEKKTGGGHGPRSR